MLEQAYKQIQPTYLLQESAKVIAASLLLALSAQVAFPLPFTPVPVTLQTFALFLIGVTLGPKRAALAVLLYLVEGTLGWPVFAQGHSGLATLMGPRGGFLLGFLPTTFLAALLSKPSHGLLRLSLNFLIANSALYVVALPWLSLWVGLEQAFIMGLYPFMLGGILKIVAAAACIQGLRKSVYGA